MSMRRDKPLRYLTTWLALFFLPVLIKEIVIATYKLVNQ